MSEAGTTAPVEASAVDTAQKPASGGEIRLSFGYFYVMLKWGKERRSSTRVEAERKRYPVLTATNFPVLIGAWLGILTLSYFALKTVLNTLVYVAS